MKDLITKQCRSNYIPVSSIGHIEKGLHWWKENSIFHYPHVLLNIETIEDKYSQCLQDIPSWMNMCTDSGGFQVIRGTCNLSAMESLKKQVEAGATMIFSFDTPPVVRLHDDQNMFTEKPKKEYYELVRKNWETALEQSQWLQKHYPEKVKNFYYILHAYDKDSLDYNIQLIEESIGFKNYTQYFGGVCYAIKKNELFPFTFTILHAKEYFIQNNIKVHFLGIGSATKFIYLVKGEITTFDSSNAIRGLMNNEFAYPYFKRIGGGGNQDGEHYSLGILSNNSKKYNNLPCLCPVCRQYGSVFNKEFTQETAIAFSLHNLYRIIGEVYFLNSIQKEWFNRIVIDNYRLNSKQIEALEMMDYCFEHGIEQTYIKYKDYFNFVEDTSNQKSLFGNY